MPVCGLTLAKTLPKPMQRPTTTTKTCLRQPNLLATEGWAATSTFAGSERAMSAETLSSHDHAAREAALESLAASAAANIPGVDFVSITVHEDHHTLYT